MGIKVRFCPVCGKESAKLVDKVCVDCYFKSIKVEVPKHVSIQACPSCDAVHVKGFWIRSDEDHKNFLIQAFIDRLKLPKEVELEDVEILQEGANGQVQVNLSVAGKRFSIVRSVELYVRDGICDEDSKRKREAYTGILQLRAEKDVHSFLTGAENILKNYSSNILKVEEQRTGVDVYFLDKETMKQAVGQLKRKFNLYLKESAKAYSWEKTKSRPKFKVTILARLRE